MYKNFSWNLVGSIIYAFTQYLLIIVIGRFGSSELLGLYSLGLSLTAPIMMFTNLKLRSVQSTGYANDFYFKDFAHTRILGNVIFLIITIILIIAFRYEYFTSLIILLIAFLKIIESFSDLFYGKLQFSERLDIVAKSYIIRGVGGTFLFSSIFILTESLLYALIGLTLSWIVVLILYDMPKTKHFISSDIKYLDINKQSIKKIVFISMPLGLLALLSSLNVSLPRILIERNLTLEDLGYFTSVFYLTIIMGKFVTSLGAAILPRLSKQYENGNYHNHLNLTLRFSLLIVSIGMIILLISLFFGDAILILLYGKEFSGLGSLVFLIMVYGLFNYLLYSIKISLESTRIFKPQLYVEVFNITTTLILSLLLIPKLGIDGAIYALIVSSLLSLIILIYIYITIYFKLKRGVRI